MSTTPLGSREYYRIRTFVRPDDRLPPSTITWLASNEEGLHGWLDHCMLGIRWTYGRIGTDVIQVGHGTGFMVKLDGALIVATAGHVLDILASNQVLPNRLIRIDLCTLPPRPNPGAMVSMRSDEAPKFMALSDEERSDYGAMLIPRSAAERLLQLECRPLDRVLWRESPPPFPDFALALGFPREVRQTSKLQWDGDRAFAQTMWNRAAVILELSDSSYPAERGRIRRLYCQPVTRACKGDVGPPILPTFNGMSGGPVFAIQTSHEGASVGLLGIVTAECEKDGTLMACFAYPFFGLLEKELGVRSSKVAQVALHRSGWSFATCPLPSGFSSGHNRRRPPG